MKQAPHKHLPSFITALNLFAGFLSVVYTVQDKFIFAAWLIIIAAVMDVLDGKMARLVKSSSDFGVELDSLADIASFGFAPSILIYKSFFYQWDFIGIFISFLPLVIGSLRLARFNIEVVDVSVKDPFFKGLPIPAAAITIASYVMFSFAYFEKAMYIEILCGVIVMTNFLMISKIRYDAPPTFTFRRKADTIKSLIVLLLLPLLFIYPNYVVFPFMAFFAFSGIFRAMITYFINPESKDNNQQNGNETV